MQFNIVSADTYSSYGSVLAREYVISSATFVIKKKIVFMVFRLSVILLFFVLMLQPTQAQVQKYSRAKISLIEKDIQTLIRLGIEADHGIYQYGRHLINDFSQGDLDLMLAAGFDIEILIDDVIEYYKNPNRIEDISVVPRSLNCDALENTIPEYRTPENYSTGSMGGYMTYDELLETLDDMASKYPELISTKQPINDLITVGGNQVLYLKISDAVELDEEEPKVLYTALHHAREPNSMSQMIFYMWYLLENYETDDYVRYLVDHTQMYFIPCVNPDGYIYNHTNQPNGGGLWRKNRNGSGVDLNRNYDYFWAYDDIGSSPNPFSDTYRGTSGFSEVETSSVRDLCLAHDFKIALNYHSYGNLLIHPWGYEDGPTEEDDIFKSFGRVMTSENNYLVGTGIETVGYTVNGDSDDWFYGEQEVKDRIFSMTPEVGTQDDGFWPAPSRIDFLNKSCLRQNFEAAHLCGARFVLEDGLVESFLTNRDGAFDLFIRNIGLQQGDLRLSIGYNENIKEAQIAQNEWSLESLASTSTDLNYQLSDNIESGDEIIFTIYLQQQDFIDSLVIRKLYISGSTETLVFDPMDTDEQWNLSGTWGITDQAYVSASTSLTDSPFGQYTPNTNSTIVLKNKVDLSDAVSATLRFNAKWDIEINYDYVQILASRDGGLSQVPLCGTYTSVGSSEQDVGQPLYHAISDWVLEEIDLGDFIGESSLQLSIRLVSDNFIQGDGFYVDDFTISVVKDLVSSVQNNWSERWTVSPNPLSSFLYLDLDPVLLDEAELTIYSITGQQVYQSKKVAQRIDVSHWESGVYTIVLSDATNRSVKKVIKQ